MPPARVRWFAVALVAGLWPVAAGAASGAVLTVEVAGPEGRPVPRPVWVGVWAAGRRDAPPVREALVQEAAPWPRWELPPGAYEVGCAARRSGWRRQVPAELAPGTAATARCELSAPGGVEITVTDAGSGRPLEGVRVSAAFLETGAPPWPEAALPLLRSLAAGVTDRSGTARLTLPGGSRHTIVVSGPGIATTVLPPVAVEAGRVVRRRVRAVAGGSVDLCLEAPDPALLEDVELTLAPAWSAEYGPGLPEEARREVTVVRQRLLRARPDPGGRVVWRGVPPGLYAIVAPPRGHGWSATPENLGLVVVRPSATTVLEAALGRVAVSGRVMGLDPRLLERRDDPEALELSLGGTGGGFPVREVWDATGEDGTPALGFRAEVRPWPRVNVTLSLLGRQYLWLGVVDASRARGGEITADFELPGGSLTLSVVDRAGTPVRGARVVLADPATGLDVFRQAGSDAAGQAWFPHLPAGSWAVAARREGVGVAAPAVVTVGGGGAEILIRLGEGATLSGRVVDGRGRPAAGARVLFAPVAAPALVVSARTDREGRFVVGNLPEGAGVVVARTGGAGFALAPVEVPLGSELELTLPEEGAGGVILEPPEALRDAVLWPVIRWEIDGVTVPQTLIRRSTGLLLPLGGRPFMVLGRGFPPGTYRFTFFDQRRRLVGRTRPFELMPGPPGTVGVVELELER